MDRDIPELDPSALRSFAFVLAGAIAALFGLVLPWLAGRGLPWWPWAIAVPLALWGIAAPASLRPLHRAWTRIGLAIGRVTTPVLLCAFYVVAIVPAGVVMRLCGRDAMARRFDASAASYRVASRNPPREHMDKPF